MQSRALASVGLAVLLGACSTGADGPAENVIRLPHEDRGLTSPEPVFTLGRADGSPHESFAHLAHVAFDEEENLYVLDRGAGKILAYDRHGQFQREIARPGRGPGELTFPVRLAVTTEGTIVVSDLRQRGFVLFNRDGTYRGSIPFPFREAIGGFEIRPYPTGGFASENQPLLGAKGKAAKIRITWHSPATRSMRLLVALGWTPERFASVVAGPQEKAFLPRFSWGVLPTGETAVVHTEQYRVDVMSAEGRLIRTIERPIAPHRVTGRDRQEERRRRLADLRHAGAAVPAQMRQAALTEVDQLRFASVMPVIEDLTVDPAGRIWIRRGTWSQGRSGRIDLVNRDGSYIGTIPGDRLPVAFSQGGLAAFVEEDPLSVQRVIVSRIPREWSPGNEGTRVRPESSL